MPRWRLPEFLSRPVSLEDRSPTNSVSRGGSAGASTPQEEKFLGHDSTETPWSAVSILQHDPSLIFSSPPCSGPDCSLYLVSLFLSLLLQVQVLPTASLSVVSLCLGFSLVLSILLLLNSPPPADLHSPVPPSSDLSEISCRWRQI